MSEGWPSALKRWLDAGLVDAATAERIRAFEASQGGVQRQGRLTLIAFCARRAAAGGGHAALRRGALGQDVARRPLRARAGACRGPARGRRRRLALEPGLVGDAARGRHGRVRRRHLPRGPDLPHGGALAGGAAALGVGAAVGVYLLRQWPQVLWLAVLAPAWLWGEWTAAHPPHGLARPDAGRGRHVPARLRLPHGEARGVDRALASRARLAWRDRADPGGDCARDVERRRLDAVRRRVPGSDRRAADRRLVGRDRAAVRARLVPARARGRLAARGARLGARADAGLAARGCRRARDVRAARARRGGRRVLGPCATSSGSRSTSACSALRSRCSGSTSRACTTSSAARSASSASACSSSAAAGCSSARAGA